MKIVIKVALVLSGVAFILFPTRILAEGTYPKGWCDADNISCLVERYSTEYKVSSVSMDKIISCESGGDITAVGDKGTSFGLIQIHLVAHPDITKAEAFTPSFAIEFLAKNLAIHNEGIWTCSTIEHIGEQQLKNKVT